MKLVVHSFFRRFSGFLHSTALPALVRMLSVVSMSLLGVREHIAFCQCSSVSSPGLRKELLRFRVVRECRRIA